MVRSFPGSTSGKESDCNAGDIKDQIQSLGQEDPLEEEMATHSSIFAWRIPWTEEPGGLQPTGSKRIRLWDWQTLSPQAQNHVVYSKGKMPENVISCDIRKFLEDNSLIEAVIFV